ncbi:MAG: hypothetical protein IKX23_04870 [Treponema sp.]|nr:hypothetical protein [Treponema sp.]
MYGTDNGFAMWPQEQTQVLDNNSYKRRYIWNERDQLVRTEDSAATVNYTYGADGNRASKYTTETETLYFNSFWTWHFDSANQFSNKGGQYSKHIYLGNQRIATVLLGETSIKDNEIPATFYYHTDHLGSASLITDYEGKEFQRIEYTPYGETWVEKHNIINYYMPYKFTGKELDEETGLYYYGARYLDPKYSLWKSTDPALGEYMSGSDAGEGGVYNHINLNLYHYAGNNPIRYVDPDGRVDKPSPMQALNYFSDIIFSQLEGKRKDAPFVSCFTQNFTTSAKECDKAAKITDGINAATGGVCSFFLSPISYCFSIDGNNYTVAEKGCTDYFVTAEIELQRLDYLIKAYKDDVLFQDFLLDQKFSLSFEVAKSKIRIYQLWFPLDSWYKMDENNCLELKAISLSEYEKQNPGNISFLYNGEVLDYKFVNYIDAYRQYCIDRHREYKFVEFCKRWGIDYAE